jgi:hypothetical protein
MENPERLGLGLGSFDEGLHMMRLGIRRNLAPRSIEEGFLDCVARLVRMSERERKSRTTPLGMTGLGALAEMVAKAKT